MIRPDVLQTDAYLRDTAQRLLACRESALDVVQETWLTYLTRPPRTEDNLRGWLVTVLRNHIRQRFRRQEVEAEDLRSRGLALEFESPPDEFTTGDLRRALDHLDEPYRGILVRHYLEGRTLTSIANEDRVSAPTLRKRVRGAIERLRTRIEDEEGIGRTHLCLLGLVSCAVTTGGLPWSASARPPVPVWSTGKLLGGVAVVVLALPLTLFLRGRMGAPELDELTRAPDTAPASDDQGPRPRPSLREALAFVDSSSEDDDDEVEIDGDDSRVFRGRVLDPIGQAVEGADIYFGNPDLHAFLLGPTSFALHRHEVEDLDGGVGWRRTRTDARGEFELRRRGTRAESVMVVHPAHQPAVRLLAGGNPVRAGGELEVRLHAGHLVLGSVRTAAGEPAVDAEVLLLRVMPDEGSTAEVARARTDETGSFRFLPHAHDQVAVQVLHEGRRTPMTEPVDCSEATQHEVDVILPDLVPAPHGRIVDPQRLLVRTAPGGELEALHATGPLKVFVVPEAPGEWALPTAFVGSVDEAQGTYRLPVLPQVGEHVVLVRGQRVLAAGECQFAGELPPLVLADATARDLLDPAELEFSESTMRVWIVPWTGAVDARLHDERLSLKGLDRRALAVLPGAYQLFLLSSERAVATTVVRLRHGEHLRLNDDLFTPGHLVRVHPLDASGDAVRRARVFLTDDTGRPVHPTSDRRPNRVPRADTNVFPVPQVAPGDAWLHVYPPLEFTGFAPIRRRIRVEPGMDLVRVHVKPVSCVARVPADFAPGDTALCIRDVNGIVVRDDRLRGVWSQARSLPCELSEGTYELEFHARTGQSARRRVHVTADSREL